MYVIFKFLLLNLNHLLRIKNQDFINHLIICKMRTISNFLILFFSFFICFAQDTIPIPETLIVHNIDPVTQEDIKEIEKIYSAPGADHLKILGFLDRGLIVKKYRSKELLVYDSDSIKPYPKNLPEVSKLNKSKIHPGSFYFSREENAEEKSNLNFYDSEKDTIRTLYSSKNRITDFIISNDETFALVFEPENPAVRGSVYKVDLKSSESSEIAKFEGYLVFQQILKKGDKNIAYLINSLDSKSGQLIELDIQEKSKKYLFPEEKDSKYFHLKSATFEEMLPRFIKISDDLAFYVRTGEGKLSSDFPVLNKVNLKNNEIEQVSPEVKGAVAQIAYSKDKQNIIYVINALGHRKLMKYSIKTGENSVLFDGEYIIKFWDQPVFYLSPEGEDVYFLTYDRGYEKLNELNLKSGENEVIFTSDRDPNYDETEISEFVIKVADSAVGSMEGIHGILQYPKNMEGKLPVIVLFHGGPAKSVELFPLGNFLQGFALINLNYRGSTGFGEAYEQADDFINRHKQIEDMKYLYDFIKEHPKLDENRIALYGGSWGGYMVLATLVEYPDLFNRGFSGAGVSDLVSIADNDFFLSWSRGEVGDLRKEGMREYLEENSPYKKADKIKVPLLLIHGSRDVRVPIENSLKVIEKLEDSPNLRYIIMKEAGHHTGPSSMEEGIISMVAMHKFFEEMKTPVK